ncbi:amidase [Natrarchaeobius chitinivorans]|uniref:Asp-tRNA(Asn)/Glu-tRNA(Gln) amidotransferase subunit GatA n=1 Tax=Natrarchaeobius chitinivorans TaxID=1679083 RepID=A0A3N6MGZ1_NATCH|nr:amidase [Natrarchaeobius chitinivorans]RQG94851.1 Asp-tRNA(Asn)/Glu-tRNA(Gln) amidotransferase subunit GatA [Natrarchaeobius chitinivorans]
MSDLPPNLREPTVADVKRYAERNNLHISDAEAEEYRDLIGSKLTVFELLEGFQEPTPTIAYTDRDPGYRPGEDEDPYNAFVTKCRVSGNSNGPLADYDVAVKDNVAVAHVEMTSGSKTLEGFVPSFDATVVHELLDAGATIVGKTNLDEFAVSGSGELTATGPILNPRNDDYLAGGSSGGSAIAVITGDADIALGTDQAGSIRTPAAWCGCVGHKPTYGLVPYTGAIPGGPTYDHVGPMARTVEDCALAMEAMTVEDELDPRQPAINPQKYADALRNDVDDLTIGVLEEGFETMHSEPSVDQTVRDAVDRLADFGADVERVSVPWHSDGILVWLGVATGESAALLRDNGQGYYMDGHYHTQYLRELARVKKANADELAPTVKLKMMLGEYLQSEHDGYYHAKAQNLRRELRKAYDDALAEVDVLAMPTTPTTAFELKEDLTLTDKVNRAQGKDGRTTNTMPFNMTGHPATTVPCGTNGDGLPVGLMFVGDRFDDATTLRAAHAFETNTDWLDE